MEKKIVSFSEFTKDVNESDGFGSSPFLMKKMGDVYHYFFNLDDRDAENQSGYHLIIGKYSMNGPIEGAKNSYCVINVNPLSSEVIEDIAVDKEDIPEPNEDKFRMAGSELSRFVKYVCKCIDNYLSSNPKVSSIHDEMQINLDYRGKETYIEYMKSMVNSELGINWSVQEGSNKKSIIISR
jgi:hypothetical protein